ncbi:hypothetical protein GCM10027515_07540 [Schumannella luteola]|uniref:Signal peptidase n=1 Tax=Schumannella luteola TaxID=472059 RepID=A0A852Y5A6_9MICO|nr:S26 family signal peptidase [Schumannella luteola]NYG98116.1 signal peptidase [Schumannella luteola]
MTTAPIAHRRPRPRREGGARSVLVDVVLWVAAAGGAVCLAAVIGATVFHATIIMFSTGSMSPTIPSGSAALVQQIPAAEAKVGDVVTVERPGGLLPITHRVVGIEAPEGRASAVREITLRGDANADDDPAPYRVEQVRIVRVAVPGLAHIVVWFGNPFVLGGLTIGAAVLVTWAFWPRRRPGDEAEQEPEIALTPTTADDARVRSGAALAAVLVTAGAATLIPFVAPAPAAAEPLETIVRGDHIQLVSIGDVDAMQSMAPGTSADWQVGVSTYDDSNVGRLQLGLGLDSDPARSDGLLVDARGCDVRWTADGCPTGAIDYFSDLPLVAATSPTTFHGARWFVDEDIPAEVWVLMTVHVADDITEQADAELRLQVWGAGDAGVGSGGLGNGDGSGGAGAGGSGAGAGRGGDLAGTGVAGAWPAALLALGAIGSGLVLAALARRRRSWLDTARGAS